MILVLCYVVLGSASTDLCCLLCLPSSHTHTTKPMPSLPTVPQSTRYLVGTEQGVALLCDRKAKKDADSSKAIKNVYGAISGKHHGPIYAIEVGRLGAAMGVEWGARMVGC